MGRGRGMAIDASGSSVSLSVDKIDNGYLVTRTSNDSGEYTCKRYFSESRPTLEMSEGMGDKLGSADGPDGGGLKGAMRSLRR